jgi:hypothetical protein
MRVFPNAAKNIQHLASVGFCILHAICDEQWQPICARKIDQFAIDAFFAANEMSLKFNKNIFVAKNIGV